MSHRVSKVQTDSRVANESEGSPVHGGMWAAGRNRDGRRVRTQKSPVAAAAESDLALLVVGQDPTLAIASGATLRDALDSSRRYSCLPALSAAASRGAKTRWRTEGDCHQRG